MFVKIILVFSMSNYALSAKILALMTVPSHSHHLWNTKYLEALANKGHEVTYFSVDKYHNSPKNIRSLHVEGLYEKLNSEIDYTDVAEGPYLNTFLLSQWDDDISQFIVQSRALKELIEILRNEKFDLVVVDIATSFFLLGAVDVLGKPPVIGITAYGIPTVALDILGNPMAYSSKPYFYSSYSSKMNIFQRANNYILHMYSFFVHWVHLKKQNEYLKQVFGQNIRPLEQILDDINIIMVNSNPGFDYPFPMVPGLISVGGLHITKPRPLPQDLQKYLDESKHGVVYFSLGSNIQSKMLKKSKVELLISSFKHLAPVNVLWKWESDVLPNQPENVKIAKWLPQNDVLAHPNVLVFFTHSGMLGTQEAIYHGKPIVGMPFLLDQHVNVNKCVEKGFGEKLDFFILTVDKVVETLKNVLDNPRYKESINNASKIFKDDIKNPLDKAVFWTEYAITHKGAPHLRYSARDLAWYQNFMLDVLSIMISVPIAIIFLVNKAYKMKMSFTQKTTNRKFKTS